MVVGSRESLEEPIGAYHDPVLWLNLLIEQA